MRNCDARLIFNMPSTGIGPILGAGVDFLGWKYSALADLWIVVAGTLWWYLLGRGLEFVLGKNARVAPRSRE